MTRPYLYGFQYLSFAKQIHRPDMGKKFAKHGWQKANWLIYLKAGHFPSVYDSNRIIIILLRFPYKNFKNFAKF